jgi:hypothetical protein
MANGWYGFDVDGSIAQYDGWNMDGSIGAPIASMIRRMKHYIRQGRDVRIVTARANPAGRDQGFHDEQITIINDWCFKHLGRALPICYEKDMHMILLFDDRAMQVIPNTGVLVQEELRRAVSALARIADPAVKNKQEIARAALRSLNPWSYKFAL